MNAECYSLHVCKIKKPEGKKKKFFVGAILIDFVNKYAVIANWVLANSIPTVPSLVFTLIDRLQIGNDTICCTSKECYRSHLFLIIHLPSINGQFYFRRKPLPWQTNISFPSYCPLLPSSYLGGQSSTSSGCILYLVYTSVVKLDIRNKATAIRGRRPHCGSQALSPVPW